MLNIEGIKRAFLIKQVERLFNDNGGYDRSFYHEEKKLQAAKANLRNAVEAVVRASTELQYVIASLSNNKKVH